MYTVRITGSYLRLVLYALVLGVLVGCESRPQISVYQVPKETVPQTHRMLGAIVPRGEQAWFFKLSGSVEAIARNVDQFRNFVTELKYADSPGATPQWKLPPGWEQLPGDQMRFATIRVPGEPEPLDLTVTTLPWRGDDEAMATSNINRWRGQMGLGRIGRSSLENHVGKLEIDGGTAMFIDLVGHLKSDSMTTPFAHGTPSGPMRESVAHSRESEGNPNIQFAQPEGWVKSRGNSLSVLAFEVESGDERIEITVTQLSAAGGQLVPNINRWRGQVGLPDVSASEIEGAIQKLKMGPLDAAMIEIIGPAERKPQQAILGAIGVSQDVAWFVKLRGDASLAQREKKHFEEFVQSLRFE